MATSRFQVRRCQAADCGLRYPCQEDYTFKERCPRCGGPTDLIRIEKPGADNGEEYTSAKRKDPVGMEAFLDNVRSAWNVGSIFRSADGAGFDHVYLCGITPTPAYPATLKTSLGAEKNLAWSQHLDGVRAARALVNDGRRLWALENEPSACSLYDIDGNSVSSWREKPIVIVAGNEVSGIDAEILALCEVVIYLPMRGIKRSYNVAVAFGIAAHYLGWLAASSVL